MSVAQRARAALRAAWQRLRGGQLTRGRAAASVGVGLFIGCFPLYGLHLPLCALVGLPLGLDVLVAYVATNVSNPLLAPLLLAAELKLGAWLLGRPAPSLSLHALRLGDAPLELLLGALVLATGLGLLGALVTALCVPGRRRAPAPP